MNFGFSEDQDLIRKSALDFVKGQSSIERIRDLFDDERGYSPAVYKQMAEQGWLGCVYPEDHGGIGLGYVDLICIEEELGKGILPEPISSSVLQAGNTILFGCNDAQKNDFLPRVATAEITMALGAYELAGRYNLAHVETKAEKNGSGFVINGSKSFVSEADSSDKIVVTARTSGGKTDSDGVTLFVLDRETPGVKLTPISSMDRRHRATLDLKDVKVGEDRIVGTLGKGHEVVEKAIDRATVALCAEMLGGMEVSLNMTVAYAKERVQFGKPIGSFQAVKHKCANAYVALETARSATYYAAMAVDEDQEDLRAAISCAKALCNDSFVFVTKEAIQIHGGIGFTDEHDIHLYYKRALVSSVTFGDSAYHRDRYADCKGF